MSWAPSRLLCTIPRGDKTPPKGLRTNGLCLLVLKLKDIFTLTGFAPNSHFAMFHMLNRWSMLSCGFSTGSSKVREVRRLPVLGCATLPGWERRCELALRSPLSFLGQWLLGGWKWTQNVHSNIPHNSQKVEIVEIGFPCGSAGKESACNVGDLGLIPGLGRSPGERKGYPLWYSGLENSTDCI